MYHSNNSGDKMLKQFKIIISLLLASALYGSISIPDLGSIQLMNGARLSVNGSWEGGNWDPGNGTVIMDGAGISYVSGSGLSFANLIIDKPSSKGAVVLLSDMTVDSILTILNGTLTTGRFEVSLGEHGLIAANLSAIIGTLLPYSEVVGVNSFANEFLGVALSGNPSNNIGSLTLLAYQYAVSVGDNAGIDM